MSKITYNEQSREWVRSGSLTEQQVSTYDAFDTALQNRDFAYAADLADLTVKESDETFKLYSIWIPQLFEEMKSFGMSQKGLDEVIAKIQAFPTISPQTGWDFSKARNEFERLAQKSVVACNDQNPHDARKALNQARDIWLKTHDQMHDWIGALIAEFSIKFGEGKVHQLWDNLMSPMYDAYDAYNITNRSWEISFQVLIDTTINACRGHLSGPERKGNLKIAEHEDRVELTFDPCGSGGRTYRNDPITNTGPRLGAPFNHSVTTEEHDWAWNKKGVCLYCAHCCLFAERVPMQKYGFPTRVIEPPIWDGKDSGQKCRWTIYRNLSDVPKEAYDRVGLEKPERPGVPAKPKR